MDKLSLPNIRNFILTHAERFMAIVITILAFSVYLLTLSPSVSFWDCGEFILCARYLEIGHPPGAPLYMLIARIFSLLASDQQQVAWCINLLSGIATAIASGMVFLIAIYIIRMAFASISRWQTNIAAAIGALTFTVCDSIWYSAVEAEVYALSICLTATTLWLILKWHFQHNNRILWLTIYIIGLSSGVHLLNLLVIPIVFLVAGYDTFKGKLSAIATATLSFSVGCLALLFILYGVIFNGLQPAMILEMICCLSLNMPVHSGLIIFFILLFSTLFLLAFKTIRMNIIHPLVMFILIFSIGYTSNALIIIRSSAHPTINLCQPDNVFDLNSYINRDMYGSKPLFFGPDYLSVTDTTTTEVHFSRPSSLTVNNDSNTYISYDVTYPSYTSSQKHIFPRMLSEDAIILSNSSSSLYNNLYFFLSYQLNHMFVRYILWNFAGRQNDKVAGIPMTTSGCWISGIPFIDSYTYDRHHLSPDETSSIAHSRYFLFPFIIAIAGLLTLLLGRHSRYAFWICMLTFLLTGPAIAFYLNMQLFEPRERDYIFIGAILVVCIYISTGTYYIISKTYHITHSRLTTSLITTILFLGIPVLMFSQNYRSHNRSQRYTDHDLSVAMLSACDSDAILITYGDNDTYPLWYLQEVEGYRTDVSVINSGLLSTRWYYDQVFHQSHQHGKPVSIISSLCQPVNDYVEYNINRNILHTADSLSLIDYDYTEDISNNDLAILNIIHSNIASRPIYTSAAANIHLELHPIYNTIGPVVRIAMESDSTVNSICRLNFFKNINLPGTNQCPTNYDILSNYYTGSYPWQFITAAQDAVRLNRYDDALSILYKSIQVMNITDNPYGTETATMIYQLGDRETSRALFTRLTQYYIDKVQFWQNTNYPSEKTAHDTDITLLARALQATGNNDLLVVLRSYASRYISETADNKPTDIATR